MPATNTIRAVQTAHGASPESSLMDPAMEGGGMARVATARADAHAGQPASMRIQTRGGGEGGLVERESRVVGHEHRLMRGRWAEHKSRRRRRERRETRAFQRATGEIRTVALRLLVAIDPCPGSNPTALRPTIRPANGRGPWRRPAAAWPPTGRSRLSEWRGRCSWLRRHLSAPLPPPSSDRAVRLTPGLKRRLPKPGLAGGEQVLGQIVVRHLGQVLLQIADHDLGNRLESFCLSSVSTPGGATSTRRSN